MLITRIISIRELKKLFIETFLNRTDKVTKVSDQSVMNGVAYGVAKIGQKTMKEISLIESHLFPDNAFNQHLDLVAQRLGISPRFAASSSCGYVRIVADPGTTYEEGTNILFGQGLNFELTQDIIVGSIGYAYIKVRSESTGSKTNVPALTITSVNPAPSGHIAVLNEYEFTGGRSIESDQSFRIRIKNGANVASKGTLEYLTQIMLKFNSDILRVYSLGTNSQNQHVIAVSTQNGISFTQDELDQLLENITPYLSIGLYNAVSTASVNVELVNVEYSFFDIDFRVELIQNANIDEARRNVQIALTKYLDHRFWKSGERVEWDDMLQIVKDDLQIKYVADSFFFPRIDLIVDPGKLPKVRGFIMRDLSGQIIQDTGGVISPIYYPTESDESFQTTVIK